jgi:hypothetical protein
MNGIGERSRVPVLKPLFCKHNHNIKYDDFLTITWWSLGLILGFYISAKAPTNIYSVMRSSMFGRVSIVWVLISATFPYLVFFVSHSLSKKGILYSFLFLKALIYAYCLGVIFCAFGSAGWLVCTISFFTGTLSSFFFLVFLLCFDERQLKKSVIQAIVNCFVIVSLLCLDRYALWPFWSTFI